MSLSSSIRELLNTDITRTVYKLVGILSDQAISIANPPVRIVTASTLTLTDDDNGSIILCQNAGGCTVSVPASLSVGMSCILVQDAAGAVTASGTGGLTFLAGVSITAPYTTSEQGASLVVTKISATRALLAGAVA